MSKSVMITLLDQGNTGNEILSILDAFAADDVQNVVVNEPTADEVSF